MTRFLTAFAMMIVFAAPAFAEGWSNSDKNVDPKTKAEKFIEANNENDDGVVSRDENKHGEIGGNDWQKADNDANGELTQAEIQAFYARAASDSKAGM